MNILSVIESFAHGGAETVLVDVASGLREHGHLVVHHGSANGIPVHAPFVRTLLRHGIETRDVHWRALADGERRRAALGGFRPDVVLVHWWGGEPWRPWLEQTRREGASSPRFVCVLHTARAAPQLGYDRYVIVASTQRRLVPAACRSDLRHIPNGVDLRRFRRIAPGPRRAGELVVGRLSGLRAGKIPDDWVRIAASWRIPGARWVIAGDGPLRGRLEADAARLGSDGTFAFPGYVPRRGVPSLLAGFDVLCHVTSSATECHPLAVLEALAAGVPIVAEARGGIVDIVEHGRNGLLADDLDGVARHLRTLAADRALLARLAAGAVKTSARFSRSRQLRAYRALLDELVPTTVAMGVGSDTVGAVG